MTGHSMCQGLRVRSLPTGRTPGDQIPGFAQVGGSSAGGISCGVEAWRWRAVVRQARPGKGITRLRVVLGADGGLGEHVESQMAQRFLARAAVAVVLRGVASPSPR